MPPNSIESQISKSMFSKEREKSFIDKILAKDNIESIRTLIKKKELVREDLLEILYLLGSEEIKLLNFSEWERHIVLKLFVWIREFCKAAEILYDYEDSLKKDPSKLEKETQELFNNNKRLISHNIKFLVDLYLTICRSSLSVGATGWMELLKSKFEFVYPGQEGIQTPMQREKAGGLFGLGGKKGAG